MRNPFAYITLLCQCYIKIFLRSFYDQNINGIILMILKFKQVFMNEKSIKK